MVEILMSTYNGEKYLEEQLDSLFKQTYSKIKVLIRDDGSKDNTVEIIKRYIKDYNIKLIEGKNIGVIASYFELIKKSDSNCNYFVFCDQDDYWETPKVEKAIEKIKEKESKEEVGVAYCSNLKLVDKNLKFIKYQYKKNLKPSFENAIVENIITGCTLVINKKLRDKVLKDIDKINVNNILMHDWYIYIVASIVGEVIYDKESYIKYRQHGNNVVGMEVTLLGKFKKHINNFKKYKGHRKRQTLEIFDHYKGFLNEQDSKIVIKLLNDKVFSGIRRQSKMMTLFTNILIFLKRY